LESAGRGGIGQNRREGELLVRIGGKNGVGQNGREEVVLVRFGGNQFSVDNYVTGDCIRRYFFFVGALRVDGFRERCRHLINHFLSITQKERRY